MIDVNIRGVLHGIAAVLPVMKKQGRGQVINVSSIAGHLIWPTCAVYSATKHAVVAISDGLRQESTNLRVTVISPGTKKPQDSSTSSAGSPSRPKRSPKRSRSRSISRTTST